MYDTTVAPDLDFAESAAELIILAVADDALDEVMQRLVLPEECILVHTSGTKTLEELERLVGIYSDVPAHTGYFIRFRPSAEKCPFSLRKYRFALKPPRLLLNPSLLNWRKTSATWCTS